MAAPTNAAKREESPCQPGAVHTWHFSDLTARTDDVRSGEQSGLPSCALRLLSLTRGGTSTSAPPASNHFTPSGQRALAGGPRLNLARRIQLNCIYCWHQSGEHWLRFTQTGIPS